MGRSVVMHNGLCMDIDELIRQEFPVDPRHVHLNHAAVAPWPGRTVAAVQDFARQNQSGQSSRYADWLRQETRLRAQCCRLLNAADPAEIALLKNTSEALCMVALGLDFRPGDNVVSSNQEFPSNRLVWERLEGVELREVDLYSAASPEQALEAACDRHTRLLTISAVQYASGLRMDLERLGQFCTRRDLLFCVDAIQQLGALPLDVQATQADFVMADGHKWLLGPEGLALFYCAEDRLERLRVLEYGWRSVASPSAFHQRGQGLAPGARRFECGSPNMLGIHALSASLSLFEELGMPRLSGLLMQKVGRLLELLRALETVQILSPLDPTRQSGIISLTVSGMDAVTLQARLLRHGVLCAARDGRLRLSPHFYTPEAQLEYAVECLGRASSDPE